ncbi:MAG: hypothetical protein ABSD47_14750 [Candidatus Methylomirabilota bacterium]
MGKYDHKDGRAADQMNSEKSMLIATWLSAVGTILLAFVAVFQDWLRRLVLRPRLTLEVTNRPPDCHLTTVFFSFLGKFGNVPCYYFRFLVGNSGNQSATNVEVVAACLHRRQADGIFRKVEAFPPLNLLWSHYLQPHYASINPSSPKHCDLGRILEPKVRGDIPQIEGAEPPGYAGKALMSLALAVKPNTLTHWLVPGVYRLELQASASNAAPTRRTLEISLAGDWFDDEQKMLSEGIGLRFI